MSKMPTISITPIYGWGWSISGESRIEVPEPFRVALERADAKRCWGIVMDDGHEFQGRRVELSQRHSDWTGHVNISVESGEPPDQPATGFGTIYGPSPFER